MLLAQMLLVFLPLVLLQLALQYWGSALHWQPVYCPVVNPQYLPPQNVLSFPSEKVMAMDVYRISDQASAYDALLAMVEREENWWITYRKERWPYSWFYF